MKMLLVLKLNHSYGTTERK